MHAAHTVRRLSALPFEFQVSQVSTSFAYKMLHDVCLADVSSLSTTNLGLIMHPVLRIASILPIRVLVPPVIYVKIVSSVD